MSTPAVKDVQPLGPEAAARLGEFARACKAAARAVTLYPAEHSTIRVSLDRLVEVTGRAAAGGSWTVTVLPDNLLLDGRAAARPDGSVGELARLLHDHVVGSLTIHPSLDADGWRPFLVLLARPPEDVRLEGGIARLWALTGVRHIEIQQIDYADILRERASGHTAGLDEIIQSCLQANAIELDEKTLRSLLEVAGDADRFAELVVAIEEHSSGQGGIRSQTEALLRMLRGVVDVVSRTDPERLEPVLRNMAGAFGGLSPRLMLELLSERRDPGEAPADLVLQVIQRMSDGTIGAFVAKSIVAERGATGRLAQALQALVPEIERRQRVVEMAKDEVAQTALGQEESFPELWKSAADMLTFYSDASFVSDAYARELSGARAAAVDIERVSDDPPDRISTWLTSVTDSELRALDVQLLLDLLAIETDPRQWREITQPVVLHIEDLLLSGDFEAALRLVEALVAQGKHEMRREATAAAIDRLIEGSMSKDLVDWRSVDDESFELLKRLCYAVGPGMIKPLAEMLSAEGRSQPRQRLTALLLGFGAAGRQSAEQLKNSANPAVRRTAIYLLREFGGAGALPDLTELLDDSEPHIQREALRAILLIGTEDAYSVLRRALASGTERSRNSLMLALVAMRDERAAPLFEYIARNVDYRGVLHGVYLRAIESLGALRSEHAVELLKEALHRGDWWAPLRTRALRRTAALALRHIGSREALQVIEEAVAGGSRGVRAAARATEAAGTRRP